jgi:hypothetical protein
MTDEAPAEALRFTCTGGGAIERGRRRLRGFLLALALVCLAVSVAAWFARAFPALLAAAAGILALFARRMSADLDPLWLEIEGDTMAIQMKRQRHTISLAGLDCRRLDEDEIAHLRSLATSAGITAGTGGFDSHRLGEIDLYASDLGNAILLQGDESGTVVTPDDPAAFLAAAPC